MFTPFNFIVIGVASDSSAGKAALEPCDFSVPLWLCGSIDSLLSTSQDCHEKEHENFDRIMGDRTILYANPFRPFMILSQDDSVVLRGLNYEPNERSRFIA